MGVVAGIVTVSGRFKIADAVEAGVICDTYTIGDVGLGHGSVSDAHASIELSKDTVCKRGLVDEARTVETVCAGALDLEAAAIVRGRATEVEKPVEGGGGLFGGKCEDDGMCS